MLSPKPWKPEAIVRLILGVLVCAFAGSLALSAVQCAGGKTALKFFPLAAVAWCFLAATLFLVRKPWSFESLGRRLLGLLPCFYGGLLLGAWAQKIAGPPPAQRSVAQMIVSLLSFQGAALVLLAAFLREHRAPLDVFGFSNHRWRAALIGLMVGCLFLQVGWWLQDLSVHAISYLSHHQVKPEEQVPVQVLRTAVTWSDRLALGALTIFLVPAVEEALFRGILYPAVKQAGFPRLSLFGSALLFAGVHMHLPSLAPLFVMALVLTLLYEWTDNLLAPIVAHSAFNALNFGVLCWLQTHPGQSP